MQAVDAYAKYRPFFNKYTKGNKLKINNVCILRSATKVHDLFNYDLRIHADFTLW